jgi:o-succinylbenzoate synthase
LNKGAASKDIDLADFPSIEFGLETALLDLENHGKRKIFPGTFYEGKEGIPINGLVWMGDRPFMEKQLGEKIAAGFRCIKLKIGSLDFETELAILADIRKNKTPQELEIRLDANGAFSNDEAMEKLEKLAVFGIHSIEQPIKQGQWTRMAALCENSPIPIALDEELIGIRNPVDKAEMIKTIRPAYIILKPGLLGGFSKAQAWINAAGEQQVNWWVTSALESNIGLNAIAQWTSSLKPTMPQGLGTGQLFENNIASPLVIEDAMLWYRQPGDWDLTPILE